MNCVQIESIHIDGFKNVKKKKKKKKKKILNGTPLPW